MEFFGQDDEPTRRAKTHPSGGVRREPADASDAEAGGPDASGAPDDRAEPRPEPNAPLAERMRPRDFDEVMGQPEVTGPDAFLPRLLAKGAIPSLIFWGPPGCGKTTLARLIAARSGHAYRQLSAVTSGVKDVKEVIEEARARLAATRRRTVLFVDEIHRFNKAQQDAFLPHVESGAIILFGATTENPSFSVVSPLLSRCRVIVLKPLIDADLSALLARALTDEERGLGRMRVRADADALRAIASTCDGDARRSLNLLEQCALAARPPEGAPPDAPAVISPELVAEVTRRAHLAYDRSGEEHFNLISALHKSLRSSDPQAAIYWLARMLASGEDPLYVARRLVRFASEDVGLADPQALPQALAGMQTYQTLGSPEGELALVQATIYLATAPKSNALYKAHGAVMAEIKASGSLPTPTHLRNAPTKLMKDIGYGKGYQYDHDAPDSFSGQVCLPEGLEGREFYKPGPAGNEAEIAKRMNAWGAKRGRKAGGDTDGGK